MVLAAVLAPVLLVTRRNAQVDRLDMNDLSWTLDPDGFRIDDGRSREVTNADLPVEAWLADRNRGTHIASDCRDGCKRSNDN
jgi:hypothetical protein